MEEVQELSDIEINKKTCIQEFYSLILSRLKSEWSHEQVAFKFLNGGATVIAFFPSSKKLSMISSEKEVMLFKFNRKGTERILSQTDVKMAMISSNKAGISAPVHAALKNGLCYGFCPGRHLEIQEATEDWVVMRKIACLAAKLHSLELPHYFKGREPFLWLKLQQLLEAVPFEAQKSFIDSAGSTLSLKDEIDWLKEILRSCKSPVVLCHNDIQNTNIIYNETSGQMALVDFEFSGPNYLAYDIANHFCEFAGIHEVDYKRFPEDHVQKRWIQMYLEEAAILRGRDYQSDDLVESMDEVYEDVCKFVLGCHLFWTLWCLFQVEISATGFDYMKYGVQRFKEYLKCKLVYARIHIN